MTRFSLRATVLEPFLLKERLVAFGKGGEDTLSLQDSPLKRKSSCVCYAVASRLDKDCGLKGRMRGRVTSNFLLNEQERSRYLS